MTEIERAIDQIETFLIAEKITQKRFIDVYETCLLALYEKQEREENKPLTLEQLENMIGEPVWVVNTLEKVNGWDFIENIYPVNSNKEKFVIDTEYDLFITDDKTKFYKYKPKEKDYE